MRIAYCSLLLPEEKALASKTKERLAGISGHKVMTAMIEGIDSNIDGFVDVFNIINVVNYPKFKQLFFKTEKWNHSKAQGHVDYHIGYINLIAIKYITQCINLYSHLSHWVKEGEDEENIICVHHIHLPAMIAANMIKRRYKSKVKICLNSGDLPGTLGTKQERSVKQFLIDQLVNKNIIKLIQKFDSYVFVTDAMAKASNIEDKPYVVIECTYSRPSYYKEREINASNEKIIFYAGAIREDYGIVHLLDAFSMINNKDYRLVIAGGGPAVDVVRKRAKEDDRISYVGFLPVEKISELQSKSRVIVSPRQPNREFVKYSFPSKSLDSLASGVPYVAHRLPCDPPEYADYICYTANESDESLKETMIEIAELPDEEWSNIGDRARRFIFEQKNPMIMTKGIVDMWRKQWG